MKKIFSFALTLVSTAFFFGCSADSQFTSDIAPPAWDNELPLDDGGSGPGGGPGRIQYCYVYMYGEYICEQLSSDLTADVCDYYGGNVVNSCPR
jgi:hypothetical protein